eukprot:2731691-Amphidinium_carterae.1
MGGSIQLHRAYFMRMYGYSTHISSIVKRVKQSSSFLSISFAVSIDWHSIKTQDLWGVSAKQNAQATSNSL